MSELSPPGNNGPGQVIAASRTLRIAIFLISTSLIAACAIFSVVSATFALWKKENYLVWLSINNPKQQFIKSNFFVPILFPSHR